MMYFVLGLLKKIRNLCKLIDIKFLASDFRINVRVSVQGVKSLGGHFACLCRGFDFYEVKKKMLFFFQKEKGIVLYF
jgi:hypothetical protein